MNGLKWIYAWDDLGEIHSPEKFNYAFFGQNKNQTRRNGLKNDKTIRRSAVVLISR